MKVKTINKHRDNKSKPKVAKSSLNQKATSKAKDKKLKKKFKEIT